MPTLEFKGKQHIYAHHLTVPYRPLIVDPKRSFPRHQTQKSATPVLGSSLADGNLIIHGDNLHALKALLPTWAGRIQCIYIDPPYNTGNGGWIYRDNVSAPLLKEWYQTAAQVDNEDLERHDKWACMMWPRLQLMRDLLSEDGAIFISIDDNEQHHLRSIMDEIFGSANFSANLIWQKKFSPQNDARYFSDNHDFIIAYAKDKSSYSINLLPRTQAHNDRYRNPDDDPRGPWASGGIDVKTYSPEYDYPITTPSGRVVTPPGGSCWRYSPERLQELIDDNRIWFGKDGDNVPRIKRFLAEVKDGITPLTVWTHDDVGHTQSGTQELNQMDLRFPSPKPHTLLKRLFEIVTHPNSVILDSFAGSGTTAHATLRLNAEDGGKRRFILVELEDYADEITAERVRRVIKDDAESDDPSLCEESASSFTYCTLGAPIDIDAMLIGKHLPTFATLAAYIFNTATGRSGELGRIRRLNEDGLFHSDDTGDYYLLYKRSLPWLRSNASILSDEHAMRIQQAHGGRGALVFGAGSQMGRRKLLEMGITFCALPYELHRRGES